MKIRSKIQNKENYKMAIGAKKKRTTYTEMAKANTGGFKEDGCKELKGSNKEQKKGGAFWLKR